MIVKICGITTLVDAIAAVDAGADMLGFNFYEPSSRYITPQSCVKIISALKSSGRSVINVAVFVNRSPENVRKILSDCSLDLAQLHGDESPENLAALGNLAFKAIRPSDHSTAQQALDEYVHRNQSPHMLIDAHHKSMYGGTGKTSNWEIAQRLGAQVPILLAGGLNPNNVAEAIQNVRPWGVDVASGVESSPGIKDHAKITAFICASKPEISKG